MSLYCIIVVASGMKTVVIGNSIVRELRDSSWQTICIPGADWVSVLRYIAENSRIFTNSITYIHVGPVRFTRLTESRECVLDDEPSGSPTSSVGPFLPMLRANKTRIVLCTIYPICFHRYNRADKPRYRRFTRDLRSWTVLENRLIVDFNMCHRMATPYMHKRIFTRRHHSYAFRDRFLRDGLHPNSTIIRDWVRELRRVNDINLRTLSNRQ